MIRSPSPILLALLLGLATSAVGARQAVAATAEESPSFAAVAKSLERDAERAFAEERWSEAVTAYGHLVGHLLAGGYAESSEPVAGSRLRIAVAFRNGGDPAAAQTMLVHLAASAPGYEAARRQALLAEVRAALGQPPSPPSPASAPPVEAPRFAGPIRVGGDVTRPVLVSGPRPEYTRGARRARIQGVVIVEATIDTAGNVTAVKVLKPLPMELDRAAVDAVKQWKFEPATLDGKPVAVYHNLTLTFRLP
ncbi:MAG: energy transducer TonB [Acidobacteriota bacterium]|nr:energy transducer TonB [Acidobacteriota bacterium]MDH3522867.1 energy transducer TonB [Acidobacteriota bacterium]